ncbi:MAG: hypothetical protein Q7S47_01220 [bacterium]|nr:hypothetical protein [bacterium]
MTEQPESRNDESLEISREDQRSVNILMRCQVLGILLASLVKDGYLTVEQVHALADELGSITDEVDVQLGDEKRQQFSEHLARLTAARCVGLMRRKNSSIEPNLDVLPADMRKKVEGDLGEFGEVL